MFNDPMYTGYYGETYAERLQERTERLFENARLVDATNVG